MDTTLVISLSENQAYLALIQCKNPYSALLYVYGCANGGYINLSFAKEELGIDDFSLKKAADCLLAYGICKVKKDRVSEIKGDFAKATAENIVVRVKGKIVPGYLLYSTLAFALAKPVRRLIMTLWKGRKQHE